MPASISDGELIRGLQQQDTRLFQALNKRYSRLLLWAILRIIPDRLDAQDILQDSLLKIWQNGHRLDASKDTLLPWLLSITRHAAIDYRRSKTFRQQQLTLSSTEELSIPDASLAAIYTELDQACFREALTDNLAQTPLRVMQLVYFQDYTHQEVAQELCLPLGTVKTHVRKALQQLRSSFRDEMRYFSQVSRPR